MGKRISPYLVNDAARTMDKKHSHGGIEINFIEKGEAIYEIGDRTIKLKRREVIIFDSLLPHRSLFGNAQFLLHGLEIGEGVGKIPEGQIKHISLEDPNFVRSLMEDIRYNFFSKEKSEYIESAADYLLRYLDNQNEYSDIDTVKRYVVENYASIISIKDIADALHISASHLQRLFTASAGITLWSYVNEVRVKNAAYLLCDTKLPLSQIDAMTGFESRQTFYCNFKKYYGMSPADYRRKFGRSL